MPSLPKHVLHERILETLGDDVVSHGDIHDVPFHMQVTDLSISLAVFAFTVSDPPGGREPDELKIQLIVPGQVRGTPGNFDLDEDDDSYAILLGYSQEYDVFVLWEANKHENFGWSKNCQVRLAPIKDAQITGLGYRDRTLGDGRPERIIVARRDHLLKALGQRVRS